MENNVELYHHGIKGMKWYRRRYQNKDGSLTPAGEKRYNKEVEKLKKETAKVKAAEKVAANKKKTQSKLDALEAKKAALEKRKRALNGEEVEEDRDETPAERKERLLKSTDAAELYKHKDELTTAELNERLNRIDTEARLQGKIVQEHAQNGKSKVEDVTDKIKKGTALYKSVDDAASTVANSYLGKILYKKLGLEPPKEEFNINKLWKNRNKLSNKEMQDIKNRLQNEKGIEEELNRRAKKAEKVKAEKEAQIAKEKAKQEAKIAKEKAEKLAEAQRQVDEYNRKLYETPEITTYSRKGKDIIDNVLEVRKRNSNVLLLEDKSAIERGQSVVDLMEDRDEW